MQKRNLIIFVSIIIVIGIVGWVLFLFVNITGKSVLQWEPPVDTDPFFSPPPETFPYSPSGGSVEQVISDCNKAKISREFVCSAWEDRYGSSCNFWQFSCKAIRDLCIEAQEEVEKMCSPSIIGS